MVQLILSDGEHTFDASAKTITLIAPYTSLSEGQILKIINLTMNAVIYDANLHQNPISIIDAVITFTGENTGHQNTDKLQIIIDVGNSASTSIFVTEGSGQEAANYEPITVADSAIGLTSGTYGAATKAEMTLEEAQIRVRKDGTDPTSTEGHPVEVGDIITLNSAADIAAFKAIRTGAVSGVLQVTYSE